MSEGSLHPLAEDYLARLRRVGRDLPPDRFRELVSEIGQHLAEVAPADASDDEVLDALERLGPPGEIVEAEQPLRQAPPPPEQRGLREWAAVILLPLGGFAFGVGWLIGLILLWSSHLWTTRDKLIGTLILPGGLAIVPYLLLFAVGSGSGQSCQGTATEVNAATGKTIRPGSFHCTPASGQSTVTTVLQIALVVIVILGPIVTAIYLARRARGGDRLLASSAL